VGFLSSAPDYRAECGEPGRLVDVAAVRAALDSMPEHLRLVLVEIYLAGRPVDELAGLLAVSEDTVRAQAYQSLRLFRQALHRRREYDVRTTAVGGGVPTPRSPTSTEPTESTRHEHHRHARSDHRPDLR
jgi:hypothetical protein